MWLDLAIVMSCCGGGLICGWIMHAIGGFGNQQIVRRAADGIGPRRILTEPTQERVSEVAQRLQEYASSMAANVDAHQSRVEEVNHTLSEGTDLSPKAVVDAVGQLIEANKTMQSQLQQAKDQIQKQAAQLESAQRRAETDALTQIPNRRAFDNHIRRRHALGASEAGTLALLDVDHFKKFNDVHGHRAGDEVLRVVANVLHARLQTYGLAARFGGEEFAVILDGVDIRVAKDLVDAARIAIGEREIQFEDKRLRVTASAGVAQLMEGETIENWLQRADDAMYRSKEAGRNCGHWMDNVVPRRIELSQDEPNIAPSANLGEEFDASDSALNGLPDLESLGHRFNEIRSRTQSSVSMVVMAIRCSSQISSKSMQSLLPIVRATMRSFDRIARADDSTMLICMPSMDDATACDLGRQILQSAEVIGIGSGGCGEHPIQIGVVQVAIDEEFGDVVSRATRLARQFPTDDQPPVFVERRELSVSS